MDTTQIRQSILRALGDGGTMDMADGVLAYLSPLIDEQGGHLLLEPPDPFAEDPEPLELAGLAEVAELTGRPKQLIGHWLAGRRAVPDGFPRPRWQISAGPIWAKSEVMTWRSLELEAEDDNTQDVLASRHF